MNQKYLLRKKAKKKGKKVEKVDERVLRIQITIYTFVESFYFLPLQTVFSRMREKMVVVFFLKAE